MPESMQAQLTEHLRVVEAARQHLDLLERVAEKIIACLDGGGTVYVLGNGGSAADAQHIAAELVGRFKVDRKALAAVALTTDCSILTAVSNDLGYGESFARQVDALVRKGDIVWALSVSGRSPNVLRAVERARAIGAMVVGFTGRQGGLLIEQCDLSFVADHDESDRVQEAHQLAYHLVCDRIERNYVV